MDSANKIGFLFDLDGVLINSEEEYSRIWAQINREFPTGVPNLEKVIKGCTLHKILKDFFPDDETREAVSKRLHEMEKEMHYDYLPFAKNFLVKLKEIGVPCALVTSSDNKKMQHLRDELPDIFSFFEYIVTGDQVSTSKPSPEGYILGAGKIGCRPEKCAVFEDSLQGVMAGQNAGAYVAGVVGTLEKETLNPHCDILINDFSELDLDNLIQILLKR